jgi:hypothetical protein
MNLIPAEFFYDRDVVKQGFPNTDDVHISILRSMLSSRSFIDFHLIPRSRLSEGRCQTVFRQDIHLFMKRVRKGSL